MKKKIFALFLFLLLSACNMLAPTPPAATSTAMPAPTHTPAPTFTPWASTFKIDKLSATLGALIQKNVKSYNFGGAVLIARGNQIILSKGYGFANRKQGILNTPQTKFRIASITKQFTAMGIMILQERGKLLVSDSICIYLTDCPATWQPITIQHLLTHTSGIPDDIVVRGEKNSISSQPLETLIASAKKEPLEFQPGTKFKYNNMGYILLGKIIEQVSGKPYGVFLRENIFAPLGMSNTGYEPAPGNIAIGYKEQMPVQQVDMRIAFSAGGLYSTVEDLYRWDRALYTDQLVSQNTFNAIFATYVNTPLDNYGYGYGWFIGVQDQQRVFAHYGGINGYSTVIMRFPDSHAVIIILSNEQNEEELNNLTDAIAAELFKK